MIERIKKVKKVKEFFRKLGPGFVTGASDDDPTGIATYTQTGSMFGYQQLWTSPFSLPFMIAVQEISGRIGIVTGKGLATIIQKHYSRPVLLTIVSAFVITNIVSIGANLGAIAASARLLIDLPFLVIITFVTVFTIALQILVPYEKYTQILKYLALSLLAYIVTAFFVDIDIKAVVSSAILPTIHFNKEYILNIVAIFGTTISPYLFFWQTGQEVEEAVKHGQLKKMNQGKPRMNMGNITRMRRDTIAGNVFF